MSTEICHTQFITAKIQTPQPIAKQVLTVDYVRETNRYANLGPNPSMCGFWANG